MERIESQVETPHIARIKTESIRKNLNLMLFAIDPIVIYRLWGYFFLKQTSTSNGPFGVVKGIATTGMVFGQAI